MHIIQIVLFLNTMQQTHTDVLYQYMTGFISIIAVASGFHILKNVCMIFLLCLNQVKKKVWEVAHPAAAMAFIFLFSPSTH